MSRQDIMQKAAALQQQLHAEPVKQASAAIPPSPVADVLIQNGLGLHISPAAVNAAEMVLLKQAATPWWMRLLMSGGKQTDELSRLSSAARRSRMLRAPPSAPSTAGRASQRAKQMTRDLGEAVSPTLPTKGNKMPSKPGYETLYPPVGKTRVSTAGEPAGRFGQGVDLPPVGTSGSATGAQLKSLLNPRKPAPYLIGGGAAAAAAAASQK